MKPFLLKDIPYTWHPYKNPEDDIWASPIVRGENEYLFDQNGKKFFDSGASWWTNIHGHSNPYIAQKVYEQFVQLEHMIFAGYYHEQASTIARRICNKLNKKDGRAFFSDNGSTAIEVALKAALLYQQKKDPKRKKIIALESAYHGDTFGAMSVSGRSLFNEAYNDLLFEVEFIPIPSNAQMDKSTQNLKKHLENNDVAAFIFEPLIQGAGGMNMYPPENLEVLLNLCKANDVLLIADEVMTGFGRTGKMFACDYLSTKPEIFCLSKGLTGGTMPLGLTVFDSFIYNYLEQEKAILYHGHSFTAHPLACAAANASLDLFENDSPLEKATNLSQLHKSFLEKNKDNDQLQNLRSCGIVLAFEVPQTIKSYSSPLRGKIIDHFRHENILLRPLGNTIYLLPPLCTNHETLKSTYEVILNFNSKE